jgi:UDP-N-acetylmuramate--alanine ligase
MFTGRDADVAGSSLEMQAFWGGTVPRAAHLIGIGGAGMCSLAEFLVEAGCRVTGSDLDPSPRSLRRLAARGINVQRGHQAAAFPVACEVVVYSAAVPPTSPERVAAAERGCPQLSYPQFLGGLTRQGDAICIAGTHGKSTTAAAVAMLLRCLGLPVPLFSGGELAGGMGGPAASLAASRPGKTPAARTSGSGACAEILSPAGRRACGGAESRLMVVESCEYRRHFLHLAPRTLLLTGIEWDHVDCFDSLGEVIDAFAAFLRKVPEEGVVLYRGDCPAVQRAVSAARIRGRCSGPRVISFGWSGDVDWRLVERRQRRWSSTVLLAGPREERLELEVPLPGWHNALNVASAALICVELGWAWEEIAAAVRTFPGIRRRLEPLGEWRGMTLLDDYAHHPTAVRAVLTTLREEYPGRPLRVIFQPHQAQRTRSFREAFAAALREADAVHLLPPYTAREQESAEAEVASLAVIEMLRASGAPAELIPSLDHVWETLETEGRPGDVVVLMGAGSIERIADDCSVRLRRHHAG